MPVNKLTAKIRAVLVKITGKVENMMVKVAKLGKLLLEAAKKFFTWALQKFGYSLREIEGIINKGAKSSKPSSPSPFSL
jgi:hypothetical protein